MPSFTARQIPANQGKKQVVVAGSRQVEVEVLTEIISRVLPHLIQIFQRNSKLLTIADQIA
jgi:hypothetical protein